MRDKMGRLTVLPFSIGCVSHSSVAASRNQPSKKAQPAPRGGGESPSTPKAKGGFGLLLLPRPSLSAGLQRLVRGIRSLSQHLFFMYEDEEEEMEMEIGFPTDVQHLAHIGLDGFSSLKRWESKEASLSSLRQLELAMAAQVGGGGSGIGGAAFGHSHGPGKLA